MPHADVTLRHSSDGALAAYAEELAAEIAKTARFYDDAGDFPSEHFDLLRERGALKLTIPKELGGRGLSLYELLLFQERLAQGSASTALSLGWHLMAFAYLGFDPHWPQPAFEKLRARGGLGHEHCRRSWPVARFAAGAPFPRRAVRATQPAAERHGDFHAGAVGHPGTARAA